MERRIDWISLAIAMLFVSAVAMVPARTQTPDRVIEIQETRFAASVDGHAVVATPAGTLGILVRGIQSTRLAQLLGDGRDSPSDWRNRFDNGGAVAVGSALARRLSLGVGDSITLVAPHHTKSAANAPHIRTYKIDAILPHDLAGFDGVLVLMAISEAESYSDR